MLHVEDDVVEIANGAAPGPALLICEHASNRIPDRWGDLGLSPEGRLAHIAWDPGARGLALGLAERLNAPLVAGRVSRLVYDVNRPPDAPGAMAERSEVWDIPGNRGLSAAERLERTQAVYMPFHAAVAERVAAALATGVRPVPVTVHSFTPVWFGQPRAVELGIIHDADPRLAEAVLAAARRLTGLRCALGEPYSAADGVTHVLRRHATPFGLPHVMLEVRNDLLASPADEARMAGLLAPVLAEAMAAVQETEGA